MSNYTAIATIISALIAAYALIRSKRIEKIVVEKEKTITSLDFIIEFSVFSAIMNEVNSIYESTKADRFLTLYATNGKDAFKFVSAVYEQHKFAKPIFTIGQTSKYVRLEVDTMYKDMLREIEQHGIIYLNVETMEKSDLKEIYRDEKVNHAAILFLCRVPMNDFNDLIVYCSIGTHEAEEFSYSEKLKIRTAHGFLRSVTEKLYLTKTKKS